MTGTYTVDASVFLSAMNAQEPGHDESRQLLTMMYNEATPIVVPTLLLPEVAAAIGRGGGGAESAARYVHVLSRLPHLVWVSLDGLLAEQAANLAAQYRLRGSDAVYAAVALRFGGTLVTLDKQQRERVAEAIVTRWPGEALAEWRRR